MRLFFVFIICFSLASGQSTNAYNKKTKPTVNKSTSDSLSKKYFQELNSPNESIRLNAAEQLYLLKDPKAIEAFIKTINDGENRNHVDRTPSVAYLIQLGEKAILPTCSLMLSKDETTRLRAITVIEEITFNIFVSPKSKNKKKETENWRIWWKKIGLNYEDSLKERENGVRNLTQWFNERKK
jgi:hypothetical protein